MPRANDEVEAALNEYRDLLAVVGEDPFKARAYEKAARSSGGYHADIRDFDLNELLEISNVGKSIAEKVAEYLHSGTIASLEDLRAQIPAGVRQLLSIPTLGPKKAMALYGELHISSTEELLDAIHEHRLASVRGFGPKTEENILRGIQLMQQSDERVQIGVALELAEELLADLSRLQEGKRYKYAGTIGR